MTTRDPTRAPETALRAPQSLLPDPKTRARSLSLLHAPEGPVRDLVSDLLGKGSVTGTAHHEMGCHGHEFHCNGKKVLVLHGPPKTWRVIWTDRLAGKCERTFRMTVVWNEEGV